MRKKYNMSLYQKRYKCSVYAKPETELDMTSLLDIICILLFFLVRYYNTADLKLDLVSNLMVPDSIQKQLGSQAIQVQVNNLQEIYVNNELVGVASNPEGLKALGDKFSEARVKEQSLIASGNALKTEIFKDLNIVLDKDLTYDVVDKVMKVASDYKYENFKFIVKPKD